MLHLDYRDARPIYLQIIDAFRRQIAAGVLEPGDKLPSVRELAMQLSINPNTIQRSYRQLELEGWIATVPGKGCFVCDIPHSVIDSQTEHLAAFDRTVAVLLSSGFTPEDLIRRLQKEKDHA